MGTHNHIEKENRDREFDIRHMVWNAGSLVELRNALNAAEDELRQRKDDGECDECQTVEDEFSIKMPYLKKFGGGEPMAMVEVESWDATHVLRAWGAGWRIQPRREVV